jgi:predicted secreted protein
LFFREKKLRSLKYKISVNPDGRGELAAKYSFRSGEQVSYVNVSNGTVDVTYDKIKKVWLLKINGMISNLVERSVTYYRVKGDFTIK